MSADSGRAAERRPVPTGMAVWGEKAGEAGRRDSGFGCDCTNAAHEVR